MGTSMNPQNSLSSDVRSPTSDVALIEPSDVGRRTLDVFVLLFCLVLCPPFLSGQSSEMVKLADGVYAQIVSPDGNAVSNSGIVVLEHFAVVFDTHFTPEAGQILFSRIQSTTSKPVRYVVNSHFHPDHTHGNQSFPTAVFVASTNTRRDMLESDLPSLNRVLNVTREQLDKARKAVSVEPDPKLQERMRRDINNRQALVDTLSRLKIIPPLMTLDDSFAILDGSREVRVIFLGNGHTDGDAVLFLPAEKIVFAGDLFFNAAIPNVQDSDLLEWMKTLEELLKLEADRFVPGHGPVGTRVDVKEFLSYFEDLKALVEPAVNRGDSIAQVLDTPIPVKYASYRFQNLFKPNLEKMYKALKAIQPPPPPPGPEPPPPAPKPPNHQ